MTVNGFLDASSVLEVEDHAAARVPDRAHVLTPTLKTLVHEVAADRDIFDAPVQALATGRGMELDETGHARAARLAEAVRNAARHE